MLSRNVGDKMINALVLIRPHQYIKNFFIFLPLFFGLQITDMELLANVFIAFISFSLSASGGYILNDYRDIEDDRRHFRKRNRPLVSGAISKPNALAIMGFLFLSGGALMASLSIQAAGILGVYVLLSVAYSFYLKHIAILDALIIAIGFILRLFIGSVVTAIPLSPWIIIMTFLFAIFMVFGKRRDDILLSLQTEKKMRRSIDGYNLEFINGGIMIAASVVIVTYILYITSPEVTRRLNSDYLYFTTFFVIIGIMRYLQIVFVKKDSGSPTRIAFKDISIQLIILGWLISFFLFIYL